MPIRTKPRRRSTTTTPSVIRIAVAVALSAIGVSAQAQPYAYVANLGSDSVSVIDTATNAVIATLAVGDDPDGVAVSPDGRRVYVSNFASNDVSVIDTTRQVVVATVDVGRGPVGLVVSNDGDDVLVTNREDDSVSVIRAATNQVTETIAVGDGPDAVAITADGARAYVTNSSSTDPGVVSVINAAYDREIARINVLRNPNRIAQAPDGTAYITNFRAWNVTLVDTDDRDAIETFRVDRKPTGIAANPNGAFVYVVGKRGDVTVFDTATRQVSDWIYLPGRADGIAIPRTGATAYVTRFDNDDVTVIDLNTNTVTGTIAVGDRPFAVAVNCIGRGCIDPPYTRIPTPTRTTTPTHTPFPTRNETPTVSPDITPAVLSISQTSGRPGDQVSLSVTLHTNGTEVAGTQNNLYIPAELVEGTSIPCRANAAIDKGATAFARQPEGRDIRVRALVISLENTSAIPDGSVLYTCTFQLAATAPSGRFAVAIDDTGASDSDGGYVTAIGLEGRIEVLGGGRSRSIILEPGTLCSGGPNDGASCADSNCAQGICVVAQGVCDGGADNGLLCDCPGGRCQGGPSGGTCNGGSADGAACDTDANCGQAACVATHRLCQGGAARGMACLGDSHCIDATCAPARGSCFGGDFDQYGCITPSDCPRGECFSLDEPNPRPRPTLSASSRVPSNNDGCAITASSADSGWLVALGLCIALFARRHRYRSSVIPAQAGIHPD